jgi:hypothetical protein
LNLLLFLHYQQLQATRSHIFILIVCIYLFSWLNGVLLRIEKIMVWVNVEKD